MTTYRHYKGALYRVLAPRSVCEATGRVHVVYQACQSGEVWHRPWEEFHGEASHGVKRFTRQASTRCLTIPHHDLPRSI